MIGHRREVNHLDAGDLVNVTIVSSGGMSLRHSQTRPEGPHIRCSPLGQQRDDCDILCSVQKVGSAYRLSVGRVDGSRAFGLRSTKKSSWEMTHHAA